MKGKSKPKPKVKDYKDVETVKCMFLGDRTNECWLMHTPEDLTYPAISVPMNINPIRVNKVQLDGSSFESCSLFNQVVECNYEDKASCRHHLSQSLLHCAEELFD